jgi:spermidine synthase
VGGYGLSLLLDGVTQGGMNRASGLTLYEFTEYQAFLSHRFHPSARRALLLGLGTGLLARQLHDRGLQVEVAELEPAIESVARRYFGLPDAVHVTLGDARAFLNRTEQAFDLVFLDAYAGENVPWYLVTRESMQAVRGHLNPGGRMLVNYVTRANGSSGLERMEAVLLDVFGEAKVYIEAPAGGTQDLVNVCLVAGRGLSPSAAPYPGKAIEMVRSRTQALLKQERPARAGGPVGEDAFSDLDYADAELRSQWRRLVLNSLGPEVLGD